MNDIKNIVMSGVMAIAGALATPVIGIGLGDGTITLPMAACWLAAIGLNVYTAVRTYELL